MAELHTHVNVKEKICAVRSVVPNKSNNEIVLVLQQFDFSVDKAVQAFVDGSAVQVLKEWNMTGRKKNNKRKRSKSKQHPGNKDTKDKTDRPEIGPPQAQGPPAQNGLAEGCEKGRSAPDSAIQKPALPSRERKVSILEEPSRVPRGTSEGSRPLQQTLALEGSPRPAPGPTAWPPEQPCVPSNPKAKTPPVKSSVPAAAQPELKPEELAKTKGPNIEKSVKDLQRCTVSLARYRVTVREEVDASVKKIKAAFAELHNCIIDKEVALMAEMDRVRDEAMEILTARQKKAEELKRLTDLASQMAEMQLAELRAEIKHFVSERKYDEELGKAARFSCDIEPLKAQILNCGEITHPKNSYSPRPPCSGLLHLLSTHMATPGKQSSFSRKSSNHNKPPEGKAANPKAGSSLSSAADPSHPAAPTKQQNGPSSQRRRFNPQYHNNRLSGTTKSQGGGHEADPTGKGNNRQEHRRQPHNSFRPKNKGNTKNQEAPLGPKALETSAHPEKPRRRQQPTAEPVAARPFRGSVGRVSQCNLCPTRIEASADTTVLSVPTVTLVA